MEGSIYITGLIGTFDEQVGVELIDVIQQVKSQPQATSFKVFINSPGGDVEKGFDFYNYLKSLNIPIHTVGVGMLASIATVVFSAGNIRELNPGIKPMIHLPWGGIEGTSEEIKSYGDFVAEAEKRLINHYKGELNLTEEAIRPLLKAETYLTDEQAITLGFATKITDLSIAKAYFNLKTNDMSTLTKKELDEKFNKSEGILEKILNVLTGKKINPVALILQDANAAAVDFPDLAEGDTPKEGDKATLDGKPIPDGDYVFPSLENTTITFAGGVVTVVTPDAGEDVEALKTENANLKAEIETLKTQNSTQTENLTAATEAIKNLKTEFTALKTSVGSTFNYKPEIPGSQNRGATNPTGGKRTPIKK